jgi:hypothetical protein
MLLLTSPALYAASPTCPPNTTVTSINVGGGALGASLFSCVAGTQLTDGGSLAGSAGRFGPGVQFGSGIGYAGGTTFLLQPGIYQVQVSVSAVNMTFPTIETGFTAMGVTLRLNGNFFDTINGEGPILPASTNSNGVVPLNLNELVQITAANTVVDFTMSFPSFVVSPTTVFLGQSCKIIFTRLQ